MADIQQTIRNVAVIGAGAWGTTLARYMTGLGLEVSLWAYEREVVEAVRTTRENSLFLPGITLPGNLRVTNALKDAVEGSDLLVFAVPSHAARSVLQQISACVSRPRPLISATKGIEEDTLKLMSQVMEETLPGSSRFVTVLSGPSFAAEVCAGHPTAVVLAGEDADLVKALQRLLISPLFRVYAGSDVVGVQLGGALKNVMALAAGIVDGLGLGHNARAALITRGLAEMVRLGAAMGARPHTFYGLSGVGDLVLTCTGTLSRNHTVGMRLGGGETLAAILTGTQAVAEGVRTSGAAAGLAARHGVDMPIVREICAVIFKEKSPRAAVGALMERAAKEEGV